MQKKELKNKCSPCPECSGSGLEPIIELKGGREIINYGACTYCAGNQCFTERDYFFGECNESCGYNRKQLKEDWQKI